MSIGIIVGSMLQLPAFFRHVARPTNAWFGSFSRRTRAVNSTTYLAFRRPVSEVSLSQGSEHSVPVHTGLEDGGQTAGMWAKNFYHLTPVYHTTPQHGDPGISWPLGNKAQNP